MATLSAVTAYTLVELANRVDPQGNLAVVAEVLAQDNEILKDAPWFEANQIFSHKLVRRLTLPGGHWRKLNDGVALETSQTVDMIEAMGMLETYSRVDKDLALAAPNVNQFRSMEAVAFLEGLSQTLAYTTIYGNNATAPEQFTGLAPRLATLGNMVITGGGTPNLSSAYVVQWGPKKVHFIYPPASKAGIFHEDLGQQTVAGSTANTLMEVYTDHFQVKCGLAVHDDRCIGRIANIPATGTFLEDPLITLLNRMPNGGAGAIIYVDAEVKTRMEIKLKDKTNVNFTTENGLGGVPVLRFRGNLVKRVDQISIAETAVTT